MTNDHDFDSDLRRLLAALQRRACDLLSCDQSVTNAPEADGENPRVS